MKVNIMRYTYQFDKNERLIIPSIGKNVEHRKSHTLLDRVYLSIYLGEPSVKWNICLSFDLAILS